MPGSVADLRQSGTHQSQAAARGVEINPSRHICCRDTSFECAKLVCNGPAGAHRHLFDLAEIGGIPSKGAYPPRSKVAKLPFNGAKYVPVALVRSALCVTEKHGAERAVYMQHQVLIPALLARLDVEVAEKERALAGHEAKATDAAADVIVCSGAGCCGLERQKPHYGHRRGRFARNGLFPSIERRARGGQARGDGRRTDRPGEC